MTIDKSYSSSATGALIFADGARNKIGGRRILGLANIERQVLTLRAQGLDCLTIVGPKTLIREKRREGIRFLAPEEGRGLFSVVAQVFAQNPTLNSLLLLTADLVYHPELPCALEQQARQIELSLYYADNARHPLLLLRRADLRRVSPGADLPAAIKALEAKHGIRSLPSPPQNAFATPVLDFDRKQQASRALLRLNWRRTDGMVSRLLNRHLSTVVSQLLANTTLAPNLLTIFGGLVAVFGAGFVAWGTATTFFVGATLFQVHSTLAGADGELARIRCEQTNFGAWLNAIVNDLLDLLLLAALSAGAFRGSEPLWVFLFGVAATALLLAANSLAYVPAIRARVQSFERFERWLFGAPVGFARLRHDLSGRDLRALLFWLSSLAGLFSVAATIALLQSATLLLPAAIRFKRPFPQ